ncbi:MAG: hypothetical protein WD294_01610 [Phycisphaeraceae bacterium]
MSAREQASARSRLTITGLALLMLSMAVLGGCSVHGGEMTVGSVLDPDVALRGDFDHGIYSYQDENTLRVVLIEGEMDSPRQVVHLQMHWVPRAGRTPTDRTSTNATVRYVIFSDGAAGVYSGAGFLFPQNTPGGASFRGQLRNTSVRLIDGSEDFVDRLGLAEVSGSFNVRRDDAATLRMTRLIERRLSDRLGYPAVVENTTRDLTR